MLFTSLEFLLMFLPVAVGVCFILPRDEDWWNVWLLIVSLFFYAWGEPAFVIVMVLSICMNYAFARLISARSEPKKKKKILVLSVVANLGILFVFKYLNFLISVLHSALPITAQYIPQTQIALPIGISFFTFQAMSYVIDVYRGIKAQRSIVNFGLYVSFFPQLIAGPIVRYTTVMREIRRRKLTLEGFIRGMLRFMRGFNKKVLLANMLAEVAEKTFGQSGISVGMAWLGAIAYALQIFFDFSGYSDMAIGLGQVFGFHFMENFDYPYISKTITEFWRRWHMSLGSWFRDYVYFPLGGSRVDSKWKLVRNLAVVWCLTGIWHGANWTFILWGALYGVIIIIEKLLNIPKHIDRAFFPFRFVYRVFAMLLVLLGWVLFNSADIGSAVAYIRSMIPTGGAVLFDREFFLNLREYAFFWVGGILCCTPLFSWIKGKLEARGGSVALAAANISGLWQLALFLFSVSCLVISSHNPFIYFNF